MAFPFEQQQLKKKNERRKGTQDTFNHSMAID